MCERRASYVRTVWYVHVSEPVCNICVWELITALYQHLHLTQAQWMPPYRMLMIFTPGPGCF
jgi:hypothetical protein